MMSALPIPPNPAASYFSNIDEMDDVDIITLDDLDHTHPRGIITLYNGFSSSEKKDYELSKFNVESLLKMIETGKKFNPTTREPFDINQLKRINWYGLCKTYFPDITYEDISDYNKIIANWLLSPLENNENTLMAQYFITYEQMIEYFGFKCLDTREKAIDYFTEHPDKNWVIRKSSITDTKYNQFFVVMTKKYNTFNNYLYVHRQGYGICNADSPRFGDITMVKTGSEYYTNIVDLLITLAKNNIITL